MRSILVFAIGLALSAHTRATVPVPLADVPLLHEFVQFSVAAEINGNKDVHCIIDTGASHGVLNRELSRGAGTVGMSHIQVANGKVAMPIEIRKIAVGNAGVDFVEFLQRDQSWFDGSEQLPCILGASFWKKFTLDIDDAAGHLRLFPRGTLIDDVLGATPPEGTHLDASMRDGLITLSTSVGGLRTHSQLDTGWGIASANTELLTALGVTANDARITRKTYLNPQSSKKREIATIELTDIRIGRLVVDKAAVATGDTQMSVVRKESKPYLQVGSDLLRGHRLLIDFAHADVALVP